MPKAMPKHPKLTTMQSAMRCIRFMCYPSLPVSMWVAGRPDDNRLPIDRAHTSLANPRVLPRRRGKSTAHSIHLHHAAPRGYARYGAQKAPQTPVTDKHTPQMARASRMHTGRIGVVTCRKERPLPSAKEIPHVVLGP